jgi:hypothetical protein
MPRLFELLDEAKKKNLILSDVSVTHKLRNVFQHGTEAIIDPNIYLSVLEKVTALIQEMYNCKGSA